MLRYFLTIALIVAVLWALIVQMIIPWWQGMPFFPFFRSREIRELEEEAADIEQIEVADRIDQGIDRKLGIVEEKAKI